MCQKNELILMEILCYISQIFPVTSHLSHLRDEFDRIEIIRQNIQETSTVTIGIRRMELRYKSKRPAYIPVLSEFLPNMEVSWIYKKEYLSYLLKEGLQSLSDFGNPLLCFSHFQCHLNFFH